MVFLLEADHCLTHRLGPVMVPRGTTINSDDYINLKPTRWMVGLDYMGQQAVAAEVARLNNEFAKGPQGYGELPGCGPRQTWPGNEGEG
jgi:hypothetical protein